MPTEVNFKRTWITFTRKEGCGTRWNTRLPVLYSREWWFVEKAGLRGYRIGDACVSDKHTNFIVNMGHAKARDVTALIKKIKDEVLSKLGVALEEEVELWGFNG